MMILALTRWVKLPVSPCMPGSLQKHENAKNWNGCVATSPARRYQKTTDTDLTGKCQVSAKDAPYRDSTTHIIFEPLDFMAKLAALVPKPRANLMRYHGVLAPNRKQRIYVTPAKRGARVTPKSRAWRPMSLRGLIVIEAWRGPSDLSAYSISISRSVAAVVARCTLLLVLKTHRSSIRF